MKWGWGGSVEEERERDKGTLLKRIGSHTKTLNEETKQSKGMEEKHAVFVSVTNITHINSTNICRYVVFCACMIQEKRKKKEKKEWEMVQQRPLFFENKTPYF